MHSIDLASCGFIKEGIASYTGKAATRSRLSPVKHQAMATYWRPEFVAVLLMLLQLFIAPAAKADILGKC